MEKQLVTIKGTKEGFIFEIDDDSSFQSLLLELENKLLESNPPQQHSEQGAVPVIVKLGYRYLSYEKKDTIKLLIEKSGRFHVQRFDSEVISRVDAQEWFDKYEVKTVKQIVRSGQVVDVKGDLLLIGDVNPGGEVRATGNIYILGSLYGVAHAGRAGDKVAVIAASFMNPSQLRIANLISRAPDNESEGVYMECGYFDEDKNKIVIDNLKVLPYIREKLTSFERRMNNE